MAQSLKLLLAAALLLGPLAAEPVHLQMLQEPLTAAEESYLKGALSWIIDVYERQGLRPNPHLKARVFATYPEFQNYQHAHRSFSDGSRPSRSGYYSLGQKELVTWRNRGLTSLFIHESQHALLRSDFPRPPKWINEGLSEMFEGFDFSQSPPRTLPQGPRLRKVKQLLTDDFGRQVVEVVTLSERDFNALASDRGFDSYTRSWALVYYLWCLPNGEDCIGELLRSLKRGEEASAILARLVEGSLEEKLTEFYRGLPDPPPRPYEPGSKNYY